MGHYAGVIAELSEPTRSLREASPEVWAGFGQLHNAALADRALSAKVKELLALAIAVVKRCDGCIAYHAKAAARRGATPEEVAEALGVALLMDGGTATVYGPRAWAAYREFAAASQPRPPAQGNDTQDDTKRVMA
jgi:AhpD family alkylhydroperoxidase